jgi:hypothetical protein
MHPAYYNYRSLRAARTAVNEIAREFLATIASRSIAIGSPGATSPLTMTNSHVAERLRSKIAISPTKGARPKMAWGGNRDARRKRDAMSFAYESLTTGRFRK